VKDILTFVPDVDFDVVADDLVRKSEFSTDGTHSHYGVGILASVLPKSFLNDPTSGVKVKQSTLGGHSLKAKIIFVFNIDKLNGIIGEDGRIDLFGLPPLNLPTQYRGCKVQIPTIREEASLFLAYLDWHFVVFLVF